MTIADALGLCTELISFALLLQTIELLALGPTTTDSGIWRWNNLRRDFDFFPSALIRGFDLLLNAAGLRWLLWVRCFLSVAALALSLSPIAPPFALLALLLLTTVLLLLRWRGTFNGGSDFMTLIVLTAVCVARLDPNSAKLQRGALYYIAIQACASYFISGVVKLRKQNWRSGRALSGFINSSIYPAPVKLVGLLKNPLRARLISWAALVFEILFPLALFSPWTCSAAITCALAFHLAVFYLFGLNRFLFAWAASYPALYFCSSVVANSHSS
jgi:hypothetical protein